MSAMKAPMDDETLNRLVKARSSPSPSAFPPGHELSAARLEDLAPWPHEMILMLGDTGKHISLDTSWMVALLAARESDDCLIRLAGKYWKLGTRIINVKTGTITIKLDNAYT